jgi:NADPH:quinone reductase-like Zn-dependent oxidoreductase
MIVVKNAAVAINPIDSLIQSRGDIMFTYLKYPFILGCDIAGEVVEWRWARTLVAFKSVIEFWDSEGAAVEISTTQQRVLFSTIVIFARTSHA